MLVEVAVPLPVDHTFTYRTPPGTEAEAVVGRRVSVPFGRQGEMRGFIVGLPESTDLSRVKSVSAFLDDGPVLGPDVLSLCRFISGYYGCSLGEALDAALPSGVKHGRTGPTAIHAQLAVEPEVAEAFAAALPDRSAGQKLALSLLIEEGVPVPVTEIMAVAGISRSPVETLAKQEIVNLSRLPVGLNTDLPPPAARPPLTLTGEQAAALREISVAVHAEEYRAFVLFGITGSGKTEVYLRAIEDCVGRGRQAIVLVPEISLTPQTVRRFRARFGRVAVLHSAQGESERRHWWSAAKNGEVDVVIGPRSAVFAPLPRLGLIVVDEEHDSSFKQGRTPRYHARDVSLVRGKQVGAAVILGSATPSLESYHNALTGKHRMLRLTARVGGGALPPVEIVDMSEEMRETKRFTQFSRRLKSLVGTSISEGGQAMLFLNRRGFSTVLLCRRCGESFNCDRCSVSLTYHQARGRAVCHLCGFDARVPRDCPTCGQPGILHRGFGTERVEAEIPLTFPGARVARMDSDTMTSRSAYEKVLGQVGAGEIDILVGTQMIAKGLHFPDITAVGVVDADTSLRLPDFRAAERTFQLIAQVAGRTGRGGAGGRVVVQTFRMGQPALIAAAAHDYLAFAEEELRMRKALRYPPFGRLLLVVIQGKRVPAVDDRAREIAQLIVERLSGLDLRVLGPAVPPVEKVKDRIRRHIVVKASGAKELAQAVHLLRRERSRPSRGTEMILDVDPVDMM